MPDEATLTNNQSWLLMAIRREESLTALQLKADMGVANKFGAGLDESRLFRDLKELEGLKLVKETAGMYEPLRAEVAKETKAKQKGFAFDVC